MGKRQHQKDKLYLTCTEWKTIYGGRTAPSDTGAAKYRRLPFDHCAVSLQPFEHPYCNEDGVIYDLTQIAQFLKKHKIDPVSGKPLELKSLLKLNFFKSNDNEYHCPVLYKLFTENSHIVAIKPTGNVFSYEAVEQLNLKVNNYRDLLTDVPFTKKDIIVILDPKALDAYNVANFYHVKNQLKWGEEDEEQQQKDANHRLRNINYETRTTLQELSKFEEAAAAAKEKEEKEKPTTSKADKFNSAHYSTGTVSAGFTSTVMDPTTKFEAAILDDDVIRYSRVKKKGYAQIQTNLGSLNFELYCDQTPKACDNFMKLCKTGYYNNTVFHRLIKNFMIQGGDPTGTGRGGESIWGKPFDDELRPQFVHQGRGVLSMANSGTDTNKSQFFITFRSCRHLDKKHTIFGRLVGGLDTLDKMERIKTDEKDRPLVEIKILKAAVFIDPFQEIDDEIASQREKIVSEQLEKERTEMLNKKRNQTQKPIRDGVGAFINLNATPAPGDEAEASLSIVSSAKKQKTVGQTTFGSFSNW